MFERMDYPDIQLTSVHMEMFDERFILPIGKKSNINIDVQKI